MAAQTKFERLGLWLARVVLARPSLTLVVSLAVCVLLGLGLTRARFSTDYRIFFSKEDPGLNAFLALENVFTQTDNVLFVVHAKEGTVFQPEALQALEELTEAGWSIPFATRVDSLTNFQTVTGDEGDLLVAPLVPSGAERLQPSALQAIRTTAVNEPLVHGSLLAKDERTAAANVTLRMPRVDPLEVTQAAQAAREVVAKVQARHPGLEIRASGMAFVNDAFMQTTLTDFGRMIPLMVVVMLLALGLILRSAVATAPVALVIFLSAAVSVAVAGWFGYPLNPVSIAAPMIVLTVAVADGVHVVLAAVEALRRGVGKREAITEAIELNLEAVTYTWLTTVVGFLCLNSSEAPPVTQLANMTVVGVTFAYLLSVTFLPAMLMLLPMHRIEVKEAGSNRWMHWLSGAVLRWRQPILAIAAVLTVGAGWCASKLETNDQFLQYFDEDLPFRQDADFVMQKLSGIYRLEYQVGAGAPSGVVDPAYLSTLESFSTWLRAQPEVEHVWSIGDVLKRIHQATHGAYVVPDSRQAAAEGLLLYEMNLPRGLDLTDRVNIDKSAARLSVTVKDMSTRELTAFAERSETWLREHAPRAMWTEATGPVVIFSQLGDRNAKSMVKADFVSLALISLCMVLVLKSLKLGVLSLVPNLVPIVFGYGVWWLTVGQMNIVATIAASICLGIIVDDTIHFLTKYQALMRKKTWKPEVAMRATLNHVGPAMVSATAVLVLGFGVLTLSSFQMTSALGWLGVLIVGSAPLADLCVAPALVLWATKRGPSEPGPRRTVSLEIPTLEVSR